MDRTYYKKVVFIVIPAIVLALVVALFLNMNNIATLHVNAKDLMKGTTPAKVSTVEPNQEFINSTIDFSINLFKNSNVNLKNSLVSPLSVYLALAMTANGADGNTLKEFESVLGQNHLSLDEINKNCYSLLSKFESNKTEKLNLANSIWYTQNDSLHVENNFLQTNANYFKSSLYQADFQSKQTVNDINNWVKYKTNGLIDKIIDKIGPNTVMYLINTLYFKAEWQDKYDENQIGGGNFTLDNGTKVPTEFMDSNELGYIKDENVQGFIKPYLGNNFSFAALLPNKGLSADDYINTLTGEKFRSLINSRTNDVVNVSIPKFKTEYSSHLNDSLKSMGLKDAFSDGVANFNKMGSSDNGGIYIGDVLHKTFINVDSHGTEAGAVTKVEMEVKSIKLISRSIYLNRPFVYAIIDNKTNIPVFIGTMHNPS